MSDFSSLLFYVLLFSLSGLLMWRHVRTGSKISLLLSLLIPIIIAGFRFQVGTDYSTYTSIYDSVSRMTLNEFYANNVHNLEIGFFILIKIAYVFSTKPYLMFVASSTITILFVVLGLKRFNLKHMPLIYYLYLLILFPISFNAVRQSMALSICFYAFTFISDRSFKYFVLFISLAATFHSSSLFMLPMYLLSKIFSARTRRPNRDMLNLFFVSFTTLVVVPLVLNLMTRVAIFDKYSVYTSDNASAGLYLLLLKVFVLIFVLIFYRHIITANKNAIYFIAMQCLELVLSIIGLNSAAMARVSLYFSLASIVLLVSLTDIFSTRFGKRFMFIVTVFYGISYFFIAYYSLNLSGVMPYRLIDRALL